MIPILLIRERGVLTASQMRLERRTRPHRRSTLRRSVAELRAESRQGGMLLPHALDQPRPERRTLRTAHDFFHHRPERLVGTSQVGPAPARDHQPEGWYLGAADRSNPDVLHAPVSFSMASWIFSMTRTNSSFMP